MSKKRITLSPDVLALNPGLAGATLSPAGEPRKAARGAVDGQRLNVYPQAAANGWTCIESPDAVRYRWTAPGGAATPWGSYDQALDYAKAHRAPGGGSSKKDAEDV